jgi:hypothetical protein
VSLPIFVRPARPSEAGLFIEWAKTQPEWDAFIGLHPGTFTLTAYNKEKIVAFLPVQQPYMYETFAPNPEASDLELATAMKEFTQFLVSQAHLKNVAEMYFLGSDIDTDNLATNHLFEKVPLSVYRVRVSDLEPRKEG